MRNAQIFMFERSQGNNKSGAQDVGGNINIRTGSTATDRVAWGTLMEMMMKPPDRHALSSDRAPHTIKSVTVEH
jgi:hypothetical protein